MLYLPCVPIYHRPLLHYFAVEIPVADRRRFKARAQSFRASMRHKMFNSFVNKVTALTGPR
jgi:hypothetical protein